MLAMPQAEARNALVRPEAPAPNGSAGGAQGARGHYVWQDETNPALVALRDALVEREVREAR